MTAMVQIEGALPLERLGAMCSDVRALHGSERGSATRLVFVQSAQASAGRAGHRGPMGVPSFRDPFADQNAQALLLCAGGLPKPEVVLS